ncbi:helix-turn-helix transcriptional regulator [Streptomyces sp. NPDC059104]|uniref:helix-turn-helix transcriptional regulator n=1 Tax=Streptomyces sp. NPDC059104 TaxID=3346729 RepID=UPI0036A674D4
MRRARSDSSGVNSFKAWRALPAPGLRSAVQVYACYEYGPGHHQNRLVLPDTVATIGFGFGSPVHTLDTADPRRSVSCFHRADLPLTSALVGRHGGGVRGIVLRMTPMGAYSLFGTPMHHWDLPYLDPADLLPPALRHLPEQLESATWHGQVRILDALLLPLVGRGPAVSPEVAWSWRELHRTHGQVKVKELTAGTYWSTRHLERRFREQVGRTPSAIARILRLSHALRLQGTGMPLAKVAQHAGFHDQSHYNHVFKAMTGITPRAVPADLVDWSPSTEPPRDAA